MREITPVFIYAGYRTGGSALAYSFKQVTSAKLFYDPLNDALLNRKLNLKSTDWDSGHPDFHYFDEYKQLEYFSDRLALGKTCDFVYFNSSKRFQVDLIAYINKLTDFASASNKIPVFKFEQLKGHNQLLRSEFPLAVHIAVARNPQEQFLSWAYQYIFGNDFFFKSAYSFIQNDPKFFRNRKYKHNSLEDIFNLYYAANYKLRSQLDLTINLSDYKLSEVISELKQISKSKNQYMLLKNALKNFYMLNKPMLMDEKYRKLIYKALDLKLNSNAFEISQT